MKTVDHIPMVRTPDTSQYCACLGTSYGRRVSIITYLHCETVQICVSVSLGMDASVMEDSLTASEERLRAFSPEAWSTYEALLAENGYRPFIAPTSPRAILEAQHRRMAERVPPEPIVVDLPPPSTSHRVSFDDFMF